jgi:hypothetical protein
MRVPPDMSPANHLLDCTNLWGEDLKALAKSSYVSASALWINFVNVAKLVSGGKISINCSFNRRNNNRPTLFLRPAQ